MNRKFFALAMSVLVGFGAALARDLVPNKTHAVLNVTYTNYDDVPQSHKKLTFVGQNNPKNKLVITTDQYGEASFHIPREETYTILCESLTGPFECGNTPYVSKTASSGGITVTFDDTRAELTGVTFKAGSAELVPTSLKTLDAAIAGLKRNPKALVEIQGHTSSEGSDELNDRLSQERAYSVKDYMVSKGISEGRLKANGYGSSQPKADNSTEAGRKANRRIELVVLSEE
ncbi:MULTISPECIES: OmpA family protein [unclassified Fibrobacter]|uniref:OmpA family protein n=1 Tax=unclassified Fibrobacter TaxID=2634177 RepID=UPI000B6D1ADE|nr:MULTISPECIES: OmpA family protein [Fibrobacter]MCL4101047.1 Peptidoglycan-associated lipoprotein [Fibrobacter succinogenes]OWV06967.1 flagellar motor protein MotB [Fibrobacter sp. UWH3]OWV16150.1 flagellar motor protein MotB [Fibrobacter sp. UWH1]